MIKSARELEQQHKIFTDKKVKKQLKTDLSKAMDELKSLKARLSTCEGEVATERRLRRILVVQEAAARKYYCSNNFEIHKFEVNEKGEEYVFSADEKCFDVSIYLAPEREPMKPEPLKEDPKTWSGLWRYFKELNKGEW